MLPVRILYEVVKLKSHQDGTEGKKVEEWGEFAFVLSFSIKLWELKQFSIINTVSKMTNKK